MYQHYQLPTCLERVLVISYTYTFFNLNFLCAYVSLCHYDFRMLLLGIYFVSLLQIWINFVLVVFVCVVS